MVAREIMATRNVGVIIIRRRIIIALMIITLNNTSMKLLQRWRCKNYDCVMDDAFEHCWKDVFVQKILTS